MSPLLALLLAIVLAAPLYAAERAPTFDAHIHYNADSREAYAPQAVLARLDEAGVARALVSSTPNEGTLALHAAAPERIVPLLRPYRTDADRGRWYRDESLPAFLDDQLRRGQYRGIGEFHLYGDQARTPVIARLLDLARTRGLLLHAHTDAATLDALYARSPGARILWAHAGVGADAATVATRLDRHRTLWVELSLRDDDVAPDGRLARDWRALFVRHPDRFLLGTDTWAVHRWDAVRVTHERARRWLEELPPEVAEAIAHANAERLFGPARAAGGRSGGAAGDGGAPEGNRERKEFGT